MNKFFKSYIKAMTTMFTIILAYIFFGIAAVSLIGGAFFLVQGFGTLNVLNILIGLVFSIVSAPLFYMFADGCMQWFDKID